jgi:N-acyl-phosphatidylethanolamine-hydrolysing phospholipase D
MSKLEAVGYSRIRRSRVGRTLTIAVSLVGSMLAGCASSLHVTESSVVGLPSDIVVQTPAWYDRSHHRAGKFINPVEADPKPSGLEIANWIITRRALPRLLGQRERVETPSVALDVEALRVPPEHFRATWLGHATVYVQTKNMAVIVDPVFSHTAGPLPFFGPDRRVPLPASAAELPFVDVVLISHDHYDHLDAEAVKSLGAAFDPMFLVPLGVGQYVREWGARRVVELDWWQYVDIPFGVGRYRFTGTPALHNSGRGLTGQDRTLWAGWFVEKKSTGAKPLSFYYAGDTAYGPHFSAIRERLGAPDVTIMPIGAYEPRRFTGQFHVNPEESFMAFEDLGGAQAPGALGTRSFIPVHWGTFELTDEPMSEPPVRLMNAAKEAGIADRIQILPIGGIFERTPTRSSAMQGINSR